jgi:hypothetical protein
MFLFAAYFLLALADHSFTFMPPCIVIDFFLNNQPDAQVIPILFCYKTLHVSGIFSVHHQEFSIVYSALVSFMQVWWPLPSRVRMELQLQYPHVQPQPGGPGYLSVSATSFKTCPAGVALAATGLLPALLRFHWQRQASSSRLIGPKHRGNPV